MGEYKVGQVLYLIGDKTTKIIPIQVIEEVVRTTIGGSEKTYTIQLPDKEKTTGDISDIKGILFESPGDVREYMINNATEAITRMMENAIALSDTAFENVLAKEKNIINDLSLLKDVQQEDDDDIIKVDLGDGKVASMNVKNLKKLEA